MQRLRIKFSREEEIKFISHLDIIRLWQRAFNRAGIEIAYSTGFTPHPRISLAAPLPLGVTGEAELMDIVIIKGVAPQFFVSALNQQLPPGLRVDKVFPISADLPSLQAQINQAEYRVEVDTACVSRRYPDRYRQYAGAGTSALAAPTRHRASSIRPESLIDTLWVIDWKTRLGFLGMKLRCDSNGAGRPEQVTAALGFTQRPLSVHRTQLIFRV